MKPKYFLMVICILLGVNIYILIAFQQYKKNTAIQLNSLLEGTDDLMSYHTNMVADIENCNVHLKDIIVKDSLNKPLHLSDFFKNGQKAIILCRFSETNCESCINYSIKTLLRWSNMIGKENILFLVTYRNNKLFNRQKILYGIDTLNTMNTKEFQLFTEELGYPYYVIIDSTLQVLKTFIPNKGTPLIDNEYLDLISKQLFCRIK